MKNLTGFVFGLAHLLILLLAIGTYGNAFIPPTHFQYLNYLSLSFLPLATVYLLMLVVWLFLSKRWMVVFLILGLSLVPGFRGWIGFNTPQKQNSGIKVFSANILAKDSMAQERQVKYLNRLDADIILTQETQLLDAHMPENLKRLYHADSFLVKIFSRYPILKHERIFEDENGDALYADIRTPQGIIRVVNVYLYPFSLDRDLIHIQKNPEANLKKGRKLLRKLHPIFKIHEHQLRQILTTIRTSPYPVLAGGDFNAVPNSYEHYAMRELLEDAFITSGSGIASTFHELQLPLKIDYIFYSKDFLPINFTIDKEARISDHHPVTANFQLLPK